MDETYTHLEESTPAKTVFSTLALSPTGHLHLYPAHLDPETQPENSEILPYPTAEKIYSFFSISSSIGLLRLGLTHFDAPLPPSFAFWKQFAQLFITQICQHTHTGEDTVISVCAPPLEAIQDLLTQAPFIRGIAYFNIETACFLWENLQEALLQELNAFENRLDHYLSTFHSSWSTIGRVCFHLAENKKNPDYPFAFLATYTTGISKQAQIQHLPLGKALETYAGTDKKNKSLLLALLLPVHRAAKKSVFLKDMVDTGKIFTPQALHAKQAHAFLTDIPHFEAAGVVIRVPNWWNPKTPPRPSIQVSIGEKKTTQLGAAALLDFDIDFSLPSGETFTYQEFKTLLETTEKLVQIKGQWVQVDREKLHHVLSHWKSIEKKVNKEGLSFAEGLRLLSGITQHEATDALPEEITAWSTVREGKELQALFTQLRDPDSAGEKAQQAILKQYLQADLRPYQQKGVAWLWWLYNMRLGGCLADDMGLGKTIQIISLLLLIKHQHRKTKPHLLVLPASLLGNWQNEIARFAPSVSIWIAHSSVQSDDKKPLLSEYDLVITTYGTLTRLAWLAETAWDAVILDEAQAIKNPTAKQTRTAKLLQSQIRFVLTGTPIENRLLDIWSLFDFVAPGLLGTSRVFAAYNKKKSVQEEETQRKGLFYAAVRKLVSPYILRRLKSDKKIISDLPDKTEMQTYCSLTKPQVGLYQQAVNTLTTKLKEVEEDIQRRGLVMSFLLQLKQICNHPTQWLGHGEYTENLSGKFLRLKELCETIAEKEEKVLVFTQFREIIPALYALLKNIFKQEGLFLHGQTTVKERAKRVAQFQAIEGPPFFVLSLKAGGTGLNLTAASHVIHFDRWWNPAVENQATDRAFRIGQKRNVLVHKFICKGTIEEKIDALLHEKKVLSEEIMGQDKEVAFTELSDAALMDMVLLDMHRVMEDT